LAHRHLRLEPRDVGLRGGKSFIGALQFVIGTIERLAGGVTACDKGGEAALGDAREPGGRVGAAGKILGRHNSIAIAGKLRGDLIDLRGFLGDREPKWHGIDGYELVAGLDGLVVDDMDGNDLPRDLGRHRNEVRAHISIIGVGNDAA
jgi:hypothetical protein